MTERVFHCYFDADDRNGIPALRQFIDLVQATDWQGLLETYDSQVNLLIALAEDEDPDMDEMFAGFEYYLLDIEFKESVQNGVLRLEFSTPLSFDTDLFSDFLVNLGFDRVELAVVNSQTGEVEYILDDNPAVENYSNGNWFWIPTPE